MTSGCVREVCMSSDGLVACPGCPVISGIDPKQLDGGAASHLSVSWLTAN